MSLVAGAGSGVSSSYIMHSPVSELVVAENVNTEGSIRISQLDSFAFTQHENGLLRFGSSQTTHSGRKPAGKKRGRAVFQQNTLDADVRSIDRTPPVAMMQTADSTKKIENVASTSKNCGLRLDLVREGLVPSSNNFAQGVIERIEYFEGNRLPEAKLHEVLMLTKENMESLYNNNGPNWNWDDNKKIWELTQPEVRLFLLHGKKKNSDKNGKSSRNGKSCSQSQQEVNVFQMMHGECLTQPGSKFVTGDDQICSEVLNQTIGKITEVQVGDCLNGLIYSIETGNEEVAIKKPQKIKNTAEEHELIGVAVFSFLNTCSIPHLYVQELQIRHSYRGLGIGSLLMKHIHNIAQVASQKMLLLTVFRKNMNAIKFYKKLGYGVDEASPGPCFRISNSPHELFSLTLDESLLAFKCQEQSCHAAFRFKESLLRHECLEHKKPWPFQCTAKGCGVGVVTKDQRRKHMKMQHGIIFRIPKKKKEVVRKKRKPQDPDFVFAMMLQKQEARRSKRKRNSTAKHDEYEYYSPKVHTKEKASLAKKKFSPISDSKKRGANIRVADFETVRVNPGFKSGVVVKNDKDSPEYAEAVKIAYSILSKISAQSDLETVSAKSVADRVRRKLKIKTSILRAAIIEAASRAKLEAASICHKLNTSVIGDAAKQAKGYSSTERMKHDLEENMLTSFSNDFSKAVEIAYIMVNEMTAKADGSLTAEDIAKAIRKKTNLPTIKIQAAIIKAVTQAKREASSQYAKMKAEQKAAIEKQRLGARTARPDSTPDDLDGSNSIAAAGTRFICDVNQISSAGDAHESKGAKKGGGNESHNRSKEKGTKTSGAQNAKPVVSKKSTTRNNGEQVPGDDENPEDRRDLSDSDRHEIEHNNGDSGDTSEDEDVPLSKLVSKKAANDFVQKYMKKTQQLRLKLEQLYKSSKIPGRESSVECSSATPTDSDKTFLTKSPKPDTPSLKKGNVSKSTKKLKSANLQWVGDEKDIENTGDTKGSPNKKPVEGVSGRNSSLITTSGEKCEPKSQNLSNFGKGADDSTSNSGKAASIDGTKLHDTMKKGSENGDNMTTVEATPRENVDSRERVKDQQTASQKSEMTVGAHKLPASKKESESPKPVIPPPPPPPPPSYVKVRPGQDGDTEQSEKITTDSGRRKEPELPSPPQNGSAKRQEQSDEARAKQAEQPVAKSDVRISSHRLPEKVKSSASNGRSGSEGKSDGATDTSQNANSNPERSSSDSARTVSDERAVASTKTKDQRNKADVPPPPPPPKAGLSHGARKENDSHSRVGDSSGEGDIDSKMKKRRILTSETRPVVSKASDGKDIPPPPPPPPRRDKESKRKREDEDEILGKRRASRNRKPTDVKTEVDNSIFESDSSEDADGKSSDESYNEEEAENSEVEDNEEDEGTGVDSDFMLALKLQQELNGRGGRRRRR